MGIASRIGAPAGDVDSLPPAVAAAVVADHDRVAAVRVQVDAWQHCLRRPNAILHGDREYRFGRAGDGVGVDAGNGDVFAKQRFNSANARIGVEAALHGAAAQRIAERQQGHGLVVHHVRVNDHARLAVAARPGVVDGVVEAHCPGGALFFEPSQVLDCANGIDHQSQGRSVRCDYRPGFGIGIQCECGNSKGAVLIDLVAIESAVGAFGNAPWEVVADPKIDLRFHGFCGRLRQKRIVVRLIE